MALEINIDNVEDGLKDIVRECFTNVLNMLGDNNFKRWLDTKRIDKELKTLIVNYMTDEEMKNDPYTGGFTTIDHTRIAARKGYSEVSTKNVLHHELDHFLSSKIFSDAFSGFINEGMTEYLKQMYDKVGYKSYGQNVELVQFMHSRLGDIFVKAYLTGDCNPAINKLKSFISEKEFNTFIKDMADLYAKGYDADHSSDEYKQLFKEGKNVESISNACVAILRGSIIDKCEKLDFYKDGQLDIENIMKEIDKCQTMPSYVIDYLKKEKRLDALKAEICGDIIDRTHLLIDCDEKTRKTTRNRYVQGILNNDSQIIEEINDNNQEIMAKLFEMKFKDYQGKDIQDFADKVLHIVSRFPNSTERERHALIAQYIVQKLGNDVDVKIVDDYINANIQAGLNIDKIRNERERNVIDSKFKMIDAYTAIEQRDNEYHLVRINSDGTLEEGGKIKCENGIPTRRFQLDRNDGVNRGWHSYFTSITFAEKIEDIQITDNNPYGFMNDPLKIQGIMTLEQFTSYLKFRPIIQKTKENIWKAIIVENDAPKPLYGVEGAYIIYGGDEKDYRSRRIDLGALKNAMKDLDSFYPDEQKGKEVRMKYLSFLTEYAYDVKIDDDNKQLVEILYSAITNDDEQSTKSMLADYEGYMNSKRREVQDKKVEDVMFEDDSARKEYFERKAEYEQAQEERQKEYEQQEQKRIEEIAKSQEQARFENVKRAVYYSFVPDEEYESNGKYADENAFFGLPHIFYPGSHHRFNGPGGREIETELFREDMQFAIERMNPEEREQFIKEKAKDTISSAYQLFTPEEQAEPDIKDDYQYMVEALYEYGANGTPIDKDRFEYAGKNLNERRQRGYEEYGQSGAYSMSPEISEAYNTLCDLSKTLSREELIKAAKMIESVHKRGLDRNADRSDER